MSKIDNFRKPLPGHKHKQTSVLCIPLCFVTTFHYDFLLFNIINPSFLANFRA